jgi:hypothetical protein
VGLGGFAEFAKDGAAVLTVGCFGEPDGGFEGFDLAEVEAAFALGIGPVGQKLAGYGSDAGVVRETPAGERAADVVDEFVLADAVGGPGRIEGELLVLFFGRRDGDEVTGEAA